MAARDRTGELLASKYRLEALIGSGGMAQVYRAVNELVGKPVAIKLLRAEHMQDAAAIERFLREARAANLVNHPNVVDILDVGRHDDGSPFIVQELLEGEDLAQYIARRGGRLPLDEALMLMWPVVDAVAEAHARGVVHRDLKPENVFLATEGARRVPKLLDFGISKIRQAGVPATEAGVVMGTPAYMAPELIQGTRDADALSDVWALGVMLFEVLAGRLPFVAKGAPAMYVAIATSAAPRLTDVAHGIPRDISRLVERCLRPDRLHRYPSAAELARDVAHILDGDALEATQKRSKPPSMMPRSPAAEALRGHAFLFTPREMRVPKLPAALSAPDCRDDPPPSSQPLGTVPLEWSPADSARMVAAAPSLSRPLGAGMTAPMPFAPIRVTTATTAPSSPRTARNSPSGAAVVAALTAVFLTAGHRGRGWDAAQWLGASGAASSLLQIALVGLAVAGAAAMAWLGLRGSGWKSGRRAAVVAASALLFATVELAFALR